MIDPDTWQEIWATVRANKLRTALTALGVFWGIFMLLCMLAAGKGLHNGVVASMRGFATNAVYIWGERTTMPHEGMQPGRNVAFNNGDVEAIRRQVAGIEYFGPRNQLGGFRGGALVTSGSQSGAFNVMGDYPEIQHIQIMKMERGRFLNELDIAESRKVAVIGRAVQDILFGKDSDPIGASIEINSVYFQVVGTFSSLQKGEQGERQSQFIFVPFTTFQRAFQVGDKVGWMALTAKLGYDAAQMEADVRALLAARHKIHPDDEPAIGSFNAKKEFEKIQNLFLAIQIFIWFVGVITLLAGVVGVSNIMLIVVKERTKEIGIRKALGATPMSIILTIIQESVALTSLAGYTGIIVGVGVIELFNSAGIELRAFENPSVDLTTILIATGILIFAGAVAGLIPAWQAARVDPVYALRAE